MCYSIVFWYKALILIHLMMFDFFFLQWLCLFAYIHKYFFFFFEVSNYGKNISCPINREEHLQKSNIFLQCIKETQQSRNRNKIELLHSDKRLYKKLTANMLNGERLISLLLRSGTIKEWQFSYFLPNIVLGILPKTVRQGK